MKNYFVLIAICLTLVQCEDIFEKEDIENQRSDARASIPDNDDLKEKIENITEQFQHYNDYKIENFSLPIDNEALGISANIEASGEVKGLLDFDLDVGGMLVTRTVKLKWLNPIKVCIEPYDLKGFVHMIEVFGHGKLSLVFHNAAIEVTVVFGIRPGDQPAGYIKKFVLKKATFSHKFELTGWLNDEVRSQIISKLVTENLHSFLEVYDKEIKTTIQNYVLDLLKNTTIPLA